MTRPPEQILVRGTNWLGDAVMTTPALRRLRASFPHSHITLLVTPLTAELFTAAPWVDEIMVWRRREQGRRVLWDTARVLRRRRIDLALLFQNAFEAALLAWLGGVDKRIGFAAQGRGPLLTHALRHTPDHRNRHQTHDYLDIVVAAETAYGLPAHDSPRDNTPQLIATDTHLAAAMRLLEQHNIANENAGPLIALNTAATNSRAKCWPVARFADTATRLITQDNARIVLIGGPSERAHAQQVFEGIQGSAQSRVWNLAGATSMPELIGLLARCDLLVTNDTGPAHVAAALGRPVITLFGPTNEFETAPLGLRSELVRAPGIECAGCMHRDCPIDHRCMTRIGPADLPVATLLKPTSD
ncbi:MAG: lipopolysaccharide heptosyltransferase II [Blastocatellia bacterium]